MSRPKVLPPAREGAVIINLGGPQGILDPSAGVFIDGRKVPNVVRVQVDADANTGERNVNLTLRPGDNLSVVGYATVQATVTEGHDDDEQRHDTPADRDR